MLRLRGGATNPLSGATERDEAITERWLTLQNLAEEFEETLERIENQYRGERWWTLPVYALKKALRHALERERGNHEDPEQENEDEREDNQETDQDSEGAPIASGEVLERLHVAIDINKKHGQAPKGTILQVLGSSEPIHLFPKLETRSAFVNKVLGKGADWRFRQKPEIKIRSTRITPGMREAIKRLESAGVLERCARNEVSNSFPLFIIPKGSSGEGRLIYDTKGWHRAIYTDHFKLPTVERVVTLRAPYILKLDIKDAFYRIEIEKNRRKLLGVYYQKKKWRFTRLPMGLAAAPYILQRVVQELTTRVLEEAEEVHWHQNYLDDILIGTDNPALTARRMEMLGLNTGKTHWVSREQDIEYLGLILNFEQQTIEVTEERRERIVSMLERTELRDYRKAVTPQLRGVLNFYARGTSWLHSDDIEYAIQQGDWRILVGLMRDYYQKRRITTGNQNPQVWTDATP